MIRQSDINKCKYTPVNFNVAKKNKVASTFKTRSQR